LGISPPASHAAGAHTRAQEEEALREAFRTFDRASWIGVQRERIVEYHENNQW